MPFSGAEPLPHSRVELPEPGAVRRLASGSWQLLIERNGRGITILAHDGRRAQRWFVGAPAGTGIELAVLPPRYPVRVHLTDLITLAPGGRVRGYVAVPLLHVVVLHLEGGASQSVAELVPQDLQTAWLGPERGYLHEIRSTFTLDLRAHAGDGVAVIPILLRNTTARAMSPATITLDLRRDQVRALRDRVVAPPRTLLVQGEDRIVERVHRFVGTTA